MQFATRFVVGVLVMMTGVAHAQPKPGEVAGLVAKLGDANESARAIDKLEQLGDPAAIDGIAAAWDAHGKPPRFLAVIASLASALTPAQAKAKFLTDYEAAGRPASWDHAVPVLARAVTAFDPANPSEVDGATIAAAALGDANVAASVAPLAKVVARTPDRHAYAVEVEAARSLGKLTAARPEAGAALRGVLGRDVPAVHAKRGDDLALHLGLVGAALNAAGALGDPALAGAVIVAMYRNPQLSMQARRALAGFGVHAADALRDVLHGKQVDVERAFAKYHLDKSCDLDGTHCRPIGAKDFYAAIALGDLRDGKAVGDLLAVLARPALPAYYEGEDAGAATTHTAAFDALRKLGAGAGPAAVKTIAAIWRATSRTLEDRVAAIAAYPYLFDASDPAGQTAAADELAKLALDNGADDTLRQEAALAAAKLSTNRATVKAYAELAHRFLDEAAKRRGLAAKTSGDAAAADAELAAARKKLDDAKAKALAAARDPNTSVAEIRAATDGAKLAEDAYKDAKRAHAEKTSTHKRAESDARTYTSYARLFQAQIGPIDLAVRCAADAHCYADTLARDLDRMSADVSGDIADLAAWTADEKQMLRTATIARALLELARRGSPGFADAVLARLTDTERTVRLAALLALPRVAARPCAACADKLAAAARSAEGKPELGDFVVEATILRAYFTP